MKKNSQERVITTGNKKGRPSATPEVRENIVAIRLNSTELDALNSYCFRYDTSISDVLRDALMVLSVIPDDIQFRKTK